MRKLRRYWVIFCGSILALLLVATSLHAAQNPVGQQPQPCGDTISTNISLNCSIDPINAISSIAFSPDRQFIATGGRQSVKLWRIADGRLLRTFEADWSGSVEFLSNRHLLVPNGGTPVVVPNGGTREPNGSYQLWEIDSGRLIWEMDEKKVGSVLLTADRKSMVSVSVDSATSQTIFSTRDIFTGKITNRVRSKSRHRFRPLQLAARDTLLLGKTDKDELQAWRITDGKLMWTIPELKINEHLLVKDERLAILSLARQKLNVYKVNNGQLLWSTPIDTTNIAKTPASEYEDFYQLLSSPDARTLVITTPHQQATSENPSRIFTVYDWADGRRLWQQKFNIFGARDISISDRTIAISTGDKTTKTFDLNSGRILWVYQNKGDGDFPRIEVISPDRKMQVINADDVEIWELDKPKKLMTIDRGYGGTITFSPDSQILAATRYGTFCLWNVAQNRKLSCMFGEQDTVEELFFTRDNRTVIAATQGGDINFWRMSDRQLLKTIHTQHGVLTKMVITTDGKTAITSGEDNRLRVWRLADGEMLWSAVAKDIQIVTFSPDDRVISAAGWWKGYCSRQGSPTEYYSWRMQDGVAVPIPTETIDRLQQLEESSDWSSDDNKKERCKTLAITTDKKILVCEDSNQSRFVIHRISDGQQIGRLEKTDARYWEFVAFTHDRWIITRDSSGIYVWSVEDGKLKKSIEVANKEINKAKVSANGRYLIVTFTATTLEESLEIWPMSKLIDSL
jgi:WD40 repeat protein